VTEVTQSGQASTPTTPTGCLAQVPLQLAYDEMWCQQLLLAASLAVMAHATGQQLPTAEDCAAAERTVGNQEATAATVDELMADAAALRSLQSERFATGMSLLSLQQQRRSCVDDDCRATALHNLESAYTSARHLRTRLLAAGRAALARQRAVAAAAVTMKLCRAREAACAGSGSDGEPGYDSCIATWTPPASVDHCDLAAFDRLADVELNGTIELEAGVADVLGAVESTGTLDEEDCADVDGFVSAVEAATSRVQCQGQWAMQAARLLLRSARRILPPYNYVMTQCGQSIVKGLDTEEREQREAECDVQRALMAQYRSETSAQMERVNRIGRVVLQHQRSLAAGLQARQRCAVPRPTLEEEVEVQDELVTACGPLASISLGSIMDTIDEAAPDTPSPPALAGVGETLKTAVAQFSAKLFCAVEDLKGRIPLANAIELLKLYRQHNNCGRDYVTSYGVCRDMRAANMIDPAVSRQEAIASGKACVAAAKVTRTQCRSALAPVMQRTRNEIRSAMSLLHDDATIVMRWTEAQARLLQPQYDAVRDELQATADRYARLGEIRSRIRSDLYEAEL